MKRRGFLAALGLTAIAKHFDWPKGENSPSGLPMALETYEVRLGRRRDGQTEEKNASLTMPVFESVQEAVDVFGEEQVLDYVNRSWKIEGQMFARQMMFSERHK